MLIGLQADVLRTSIRDAKEIKRALAGLRILYPEPIHLGTGLIYIAACYIQFAWPFNTHWSSPYHSLPPVPTAFAVCHALLANAPVALPRAVSRLGDPCTYPWLARDPALLCALDMAEAMDPKQLDAPEASFPPIAPAKLRTPSSDATHVVASAAPVHAAYRPYWTLRPFAILRCCAAQSHYLWVSRSLHCAAGRTCRDRPELAVSDSGSRQIQTDRDTESCRLRYSGLFSTGYHWSASATVIWRNRHVVRAK